MDRWRRERGEGGREDPAGEQPRYIVPLAVNKTRQCSEDRLRPCVAAGKLWSAHAHVCRDVRCVCVCVCARSGSLTAVCSGKARAFICLLAGPGINNAAIRYKNEKKGWKEYGQGYGKDLDCGPIERAGGTVPWRGARGGGRRGRAGEG